MTTHQMRMNSSVVRHKWPNNVRCPIAVTLDNMGEAADLNRGLHEGPVGSHYSVKEALPKVLALLKKHEIHCTYFIESWNLSQYPSVVADKVAGAGHEVAWHAWQHEAWSKLDDESERDNFERSFGDHGLDGFIAGKGRGKCLPYRGFRPPGGIIRDQTLGLCLDYGLSYISPAAEDAAVVSAKGSSRSGDIVVLPFRWRTVDAFYYMEAFSGLRQAKGEQEAVMSEGTLASRYIAEIDMAIEKGEFLSLLFHPFLTNSMSRLKAMDQVLAYLASKRDEGVIWLERCRDIDQYIRQNTRSVGKDPKWDSCQWR